MGLFGSHLSAMRVTENDRSNRHRDTLLSDSQKLRCHKDRSAKVNDYRLKLCLSRSRASQQLNKLFFGFANQR
jgi:hypothetical protein